MIDLMVGLVYMAVGCSTTITMYKHSRWKYPNDYRVIQGVFAGLAFFTWPIMAITHHIEVLKALRNETRNKAK